MVPKYCMNTRMSGKNWCLSFIKGWQIKGDKGIQKEVDDMEDGKMVNWKDGNRICLPVTHLFPPFVFASETFGYPFIHFPCPSIDSLLLLTYGKQFILSPTHPTKSLSWILVQFTPSRIRIWILNTKLFHSILPSVLIRNSKFDVQSPLYARRYIPFGRLK